MPEKHSAEVFIFYIFQCFHKKSKSFTSYTASPTDGNISRGGEHVSLPSTLCDCLIRIRNFPEQIYEAVFGYDGTADDTAITQHIKNIRAKLRVAGAGEVLQTIWGVGYQWQNEN